MRSQVRRPFSESWIVIVVGCDCDDVFGCECSFALMVSVAVCGCPSVSVGCLSWSVYVCCLLLLAGALTNKENGMGQSWKVSAVVIWVVV